MRLSRGDDARHRGVRSRGGVDGPVEAETAGPGSSRALGPAFGSAGHQGPATPPRHQRQEPDGHLCHRRPLVVRCRSTLRRVALGQRGNHAAHAATGVDPAGRCGSHADAHRNCAAHFPAPILSAVSRRALRRRVRRVLPARRRAGPRSADAGCRGTRADLHAAGKSSSHRSRVHLLRGTGAHLHSDRLLLPACRGIAALDATLELAAGRHHTALAGPAAGADRDDPVERPSSRPAPSTVAEIFSHPEAKKIARQPWVGRLAQIAACLLLVVFVWFGSRAISTGRQPSRGIDAGQETAAVGTGPGAAPQEAAPKGFFGRVQSAIANRATVEMSENLHAGMEAWGSKGWAPGWSRNAEGYVHPGELALFRPTLNYTDYRLEFFGQIENKSMGWVVRARDKQNYYAMKFTVIESGLRPVIAMVHYPVVGGKKGQKMETPLSVMVHQQHALPRGRGRRGQPLHRLHRRPEGRVVDGRHTGHRRSRFLQRSRREGAALLDEGLEESGLAGVDLLLPGRQRFAADGGALGTRASGKLPHRPAGRAAQT